MKRGLIIGGIILILAVIIYSMTVGAYNNMIALRNKVKRQWAQVENVYQRRADLIPNLVNTVKGYAAHEQQTLSMVVEARAKATSINVNADDLSPEALRKFQEAQAGLSSALSRLLVTVEKYPDLKANQNFLELQAQLEGSENRIAQERKVFNEVVEEYNTYIQRFPNSLIASFGGFKEKAFFEADASAQKTPEVKF